MEEVLGKLEDGRKKNGCKPGENRGGGWKTPMEKVRAQAKEEAFEIMKAEFWVRLAQEKALPRLVKILENPDDSVAFKAAKEILDRSLGKPKESIDHTTNGKDLPTPILPLGYVRSNNGNTEDLSAHEANTSTPGGDVVKQDSVDALIPDSESTSG